MRSVEIITQLEQTSSSTQKQLILKEAWLSGERDFFHLANMAYDPFVTFGCKKVAEIIGEDDPSGAFTISDFILLSKQLSTRRLTGNAAKNAIHAAASDCPSAIWNKVYRRVLLKDLKCGIGAKLINKVLTELELTAPGAIAFLIPTFGTMLAHDGSVHTKKLVGEKYLDPKLDGVRMLTIVDPHTKTIKQYTRNGAENTTFSGLVNKLAPMLDILPDAIVLDGEVVSANFQQLMTQVNRKYDINTDDAKLALFDIIPLVDFMAGECLKPQHERHAVLVELSGILQQLSKGAIYVIPKMLVDLDTDDGQDKLLQFRDDALTAGYEGIMVKDYAAPYVAKRSYAWLKIKPTISVDLTVVDVLPGEPGSRLENSLGALVGEGTTEDGMKIITNVGSGFSDGERQNIWDAFQSGGVIGQVFEVLGDTITQNKDSNDVWSVRFPRFNRWRSIDNIPFIKD